MKYLIIWTITYELDNLMGLECNPSVTDRLYKFFENKNDLNDFIIKLKKEDYDFLLIDDIFEFDNCTSVQHKFYESLNYYE